MNYFSSFIQQLPTIPWTADASQSTPPAENYLLIWVDGNIDQNNESCQNVLAQFSKVIKEVQSCTEPEECMKRLNDMSNKKALVICSGALGEGLMPKIHDMENVVAIYIYCLNEAVHEVWAKEWSKIQGVYTEIAPMLESIKRSPRTWSIDRVSQWLTELGLAEYHDAFAENGIDGLALTKIDFIDNKLKELIPDVKPRTKLKKALIKLLGVEYVESLKKKVDGQLKQLELQDEELVKLKGVVSNLTESNKFKDEALETQKQQIQAQQTQIEIQRQQIQTQKEQTQERDRQIALLGKNIEDQKNQIDALVQTVEKLRLVPKKPLALPSILPATQSIIQNVSLGAPFINPAPPGSSVNKTPQMQPGNPALIAVSSSDGKPLQPGQSLPIVVDGPNSNVTFPARTQSNGNIAIIPQVNDQYDITNYGTYQVAIFNDVGQEMLVSTAITVVPEAKICIPKQFVIKDAHNNIVVGGRVILKRKDGTVAFNGVTDNTGIVRMPDILPDGTYDVEINPNQAQLKPLNFKMVVFQNQRPPTDAYFLSVVVTNPTAMTFVLRWGTAPQDLDSHMYASNGTHVFYSKKADGTMTLDCDVTSGNGPETISVIFQPGVKYVYAVHRYSKDGELTNSNAELSIYGTQLEPIKKFNVLKENQPQANFWIVCVIDGTTRNIKYINKFETHDNFRTNEVGTKYFNA